jgi:hypothetical protein
MTCHARTREGRLTVNPPAFDRKRWKRFAELIDEDDAGLRRHRRMKGRGRDRIDRELTPLLRIKDRVRRMAADIPEPDPAARRDIRAFLMAEIERAGIGVTADARAARLASSAALADRTEVLPAVPRGAGRTRTTLLTGVIVGVLALSGVSMASVRALPGEPLYSVKRSSERVKLVLAGSEISRAQLLLQFAHERIIEAGHVDRRLLGEVLADMDATTRQAVSLLDQTAVAHGDAATLDIVLDFVAAQRQHIGEVARIRTVEAGDNLTASLALLDSVETRARQIRAAMAKGCTFTTFDALGPKPDC